jgi:hypothetical protein
MTLSQSVPEEDVIDDGDNHEKNLRSVRSIDPKNWSNRDFNTSEIYNVKRAR